MIKVLRKVDELGRIVIPIDVRKQLEINEGETLEISIENNKVVLEKKYA